MSWPTARAMGKTTCIVIPKRVFGRVLKQSNPVVIAVVNTLLRRLRNDANSKVKKTLGYPDEILNEVRAATFSASSNDIWIEKIRCKTRPVQDLVAVRKRADALGEIARSLEELKNDEIATEAVKTALDALFKKLHSEALERFPELQAMTEDTKLFQSMMDEAGMMVLPNLPIPVCAPVSKFEPWPNCIAPRNASLSIPSALS